MTAYIVVTALVSACTMAFPLALIGKGPSGVFTTIKEGGWTMWPMLLAMPVVAILVGVISGLAIRGRAIPAAAIVGVALSPVLVGALGTSLSQRQMDNVLAGESIDPWQRMRIAFEGTQEALASLQFGGAIAAFALGAACVGSASIVASIDRVRVGRPAGIAWLFSALVPVVGALISIVLMAVTHSLGAAPGTFAISLASLALVAVFAALAARAAPALRDYHDPGEQKRMLGAILAACVAGALALWLLDRTAMLGIERMVLGACSGESVDPSQRARILMQGRFESRAFGFIAWLHVVTVVLAFAPAIVTGMSKGRIPFGPGGMAAFALGVLGFLLHVGVNARAEGFLATMAAAARPVAYPVTLPSAPNPGMLGTPHAPVVVVDKSGTQLTTLPRKSDDDLDGNPWQTFAADRDARALAVFALMVQPRGTRAKGEPRSVDLLVMPEQDPGGQLDQVDPDIRAMVRPQNVSVPLEFANTRSGGQRPSITFVDDTTVLVDGVTTLRFGPTFSGELQREIGGSRYGQFDLYVNIRESTTVGALVTVVSAATDRGTPDVHVMLAGPDNPAMPPSAKRGL
jgi:MFS family permease